MSFPSSKMKFSVSPIHHLNSFSNASTSPPRCLGFHRHCRRPPPPLHPRPPYPPKRSGIRCSVDRRELFSRIAPVYDNLNDLLTFGQHRVWKKMCVSWSGAKKGDVVLDLCCGSGDLTFLMSQKVGTSGEVCALDFSRTPLVIASTRQDLFWKACYKNIKWIEGDAQNIPFEDSCFDAITVGYGLRNLIDKQKAMQEIFRVLKPGSCVSLLDFNKSTSSSVTQFQEWAIDNVVVPAASTYGLSEEYKYLKSSIAEFFTAREEEDTPKKEMKVIVLQAEEMKVSESGSEGGEEEEDEKEISLIFKWLGAILRRQRYGK